jgi:hypothetical protein
VFYFGRLESPSQISRRIPLTAGSGHGISEYLSAALKDAVCRFVDSPGFDTPHNFKKVSRLDGLYGHVADMGKDEAV